MRKLAHAGAHAWIGQCGLGTALAAGVLFSGSATAADFGATWVGDFAAVVDGGLQQGERALGLIDLSIEHSLTLVERDVRLYASLHHTYGGGFSERWVGDLQTVSNIDADGGTRLLEAWVEVPVAAGMSLRAGRYDMNTEFDAIGTGALFLSSAQGMGTDISQSGAAGPSTFPRTAFGLRAQFDLGQGGAMRSAILDVESETTDAGGDIPFTGGPLLAMEYQRTRGDVTLKLGAWGFTETRSAIAADEDRGREYGAYVSAEHRVSDRLAWYARYGAANTQVARIGRYVGAGVVYSGGLLPGRGDTLGFAVGQARNGDPYRESQQAAGATTTAAETAYELTWRIPLGAHFALQPDVQYIDDPNTDPSLADALVVILRIEAAF